MYSYEDRIRAVKLYIKLGKRVAASIHQLGYPTQSKFLAASPSTRAELCGGRGVTSVPTATTASQHASAERYPSRLCATCRT